MFSGLALKKLMGLCWILSLASLHKMCFKIHETGAHPNLATGPTSGMVQSLSIQHKSGSASDPRVLGEGQRLSLKWELIDYQTNNK